MGAPQTTREALMAELLGDVGALLDKADSLQNALPAVADVAASQIYLAGEAASKNIKAEAEQFRAMLAREREALTRPVQEASEQTRLAADVVEGAGRRLAMLALGLGLAAGALAGAIAGIAAASIFIG